MSPDERPRQVITIAFYAVLMALLAMLVHPTPKVDYTVYNDFFVQSLARQETVKESMKLRISQMIQYGEIKDIAWQHAMSVDSTAGVFLHKTEQIKLLLSSSLANSQLKSPFQIERKSNTIAHEYFVLNHGSDSLQILTEGTLNYLSSFINLTTRNSIHPLIDQIWTNFSGTTPYEETLQNGNLKEDKKWCQKVFAHENVTSAIALLSMIQLNLIQTENLIVPFIVNENLKFGCSNYLAHGDFLVPQEGLILKNSLVKGNIYSCDILPVGQIPIFEADSGKMIPGPQGQVYGVWSAIAKSIGLNRIHGTESIMGMDGPAVYPWSFSFFVAAPGVSLGRDNSNIVYRIVDNPVSVSVPGYPLNKVSLRVPGAKVKKISDGRYTITVIEKAGSKLMAYTDATNEKGITSNVNITELTVKDLPPPDCRFTGAQNDTLSMHSLMEKGGISIRQQDSDLNVEYELLGYDMYLLKVNKQCIGPIHCTRTSFSENESLAPFLSQAETGDKIFIGNIAVSSGGQKNMHLPALSAIVN